MARSFEDTHWHSTNEMVKEFRKEMQGLPQESRSSAALEEFAVQLMHLNSHLEELTKATYEGNN